ncbi:MAG: nucleotide exchange factor GrpE [Scytonema sp. PMC 1069.18]|nr:nucleotide exchange factor GrpE [Scytonema sp. PMC 1069.18]MEC4887375.1 nucleotide exchange factor GrpE [Scytonema sp. PMC 1070.18]
MINEDKQPNDTNQQLDEPTEEKQAMTTDSTTPMNVNDSANEVNQQVENQTDVADSTTPNGDNGVAATTETTADEFKAKEAELTKQIESLKAQVEERSTQYMRIAADFENFRKRNQKEKEDLEQQIKRTTITELLPVVDNFERARSQIKPQNDGEMTIHKSYQGVYKLLVDCLKRLGVSPMRPEHQPFDPNLHEAVLREPTDEYPEGTVLEELVRGYYLGERVLRHAMVKVAAPKEEAPSSEENQSSSADS